MIMALSYVNPMSEIRDSIDRLFSGFADESRMPSLVSSEWPSGGLKTASPWMPSIEVSETDKEVLISAALPGIKPEDIRVEMSGNTLVLSGEMRRETRQDETQFHRSEFRYGHFMRSIPLPDYVNGDACNAEFKNGMLEVHIPKTEVSQRKRIEVNVR
jgi:HSP20 family protein